MCIRDSYCTECPLVGNTDPFHGDCLPTLSDTETRDCEYTECGACLKTDKKICTQCVSGMDLTGGRCIPSDTTSSSLWCVNSQCNGCLKVDRHYCKACWWGWSFNHGTCSVCNPFCASCVRDSPNLCATCYGGRAPVDGRCQAPQQLIPLYSKRIVRSLSIIYQMHFLVEFVLKPIIYFYRLSSVQ
eukprot:TRINITY_DN395_c0_g2_i3.p1 TRINITY_DN395_c0_g2~~TRINITY_DN395_c0_g2_i3.p1  ORF type:complete len:186 (-),score=11.68 TRINITY_DN395_c0_g2_i3:125-682(-)